MPATDTTDDDSKDSIDRVYIDTAESSADELADELKAFLGAVEAGDPDADALRSLQRSAIETLLAVRDAAAVAEVFDDHDPSHRATEDLLRATHLADDRGPNAAARDRIDAALTWLDEADEN